MAAVEAAACSTQVTKVGMAALEAAACSTQVCGLGMAAMGVAACSTQVCGLGMAAMGAAAYSFHVYKLGWHIHFPSCACCTLSYVREGQGMCLWQARHQFQLILPSLQVSILGWQVSNQGPATLLAHTSTSTFPPVSAAVSLMTGKGKECVWVRARHQIQLILPSLQVSILGWQAPNRALLFSYELK
jgi:hypothetical protein